MPNIWRATPNTAVDDPGAFAVGSLDTDPTNPWGRTNPWAYDGAVYGYREVGDFGSIQYSVLGGIITLCTADPIDASEKTNIITQLNAGCNALVFTGPNPLHLGTLDATVDDVWSTSIRCDLSGGGLSQLIKGSMAVWGIARDVLSSNDLGQDAMPLTMQYGEAGGFAVLTLTFPTEAGNDLWWNVLVPEIITLWNEH